MSRFLQWQMGFAEQCRRSCLELSLNTNKDVIVTFSPQRRHAETVSTIMRLGGGGHWRLSLITNRDSF